MSWDDYRLVLDLGYATLPRLLAHSPDGAVNAVVITHEHSDHCIDLHGLFRMRFYGGTRRPKLPLYCSRGVLARLGGLEPEVDLRTVFEVHAMPGTHQVGPFTLTSVPLPHFVPNTGVRLHELFTAMRRNWGRLASSESGLSLSQLALLDAVTTDGPPLVGQIAAHAGVSGPSATRMLKQLERRGVVTRQRSSLDERKVLVTLTERGRDLVARQRTALRDKQRHDYAALNPRRREAFVDVLRQMATMVDKWSPD